MEKTGIAIVGLGTVGSGVAKLLLEHGDRTARHAGRSLWLRHAVVSDISKQRQVDLPDGVLTDDFDRVLADKDVDVVCQLVGGIDNARRLMLKSLEAGKDVVTANKALLAEHGPELFQRARELGRSIAFEASVCGGVPVITTISQSLSANQIGSLCGILNGTCNYIVSQMDEAGADYHATLAEAKQLGFAEADPTFDVDGSDAAQKLAILAHLAYGAKVRWTDIPRRGVDSLQKMDFSFARQLGYRIKLIALANLERGGLQLAVAPMLTKIGSPLSEVRENFNALRVEGDAVGPVFLHGQGAGQMPTASAVVADLIDVAVGRTAITFQTLELWSENGPDVMVDNPGNLLGTYYLRFNVDDRPGVLAQIAGILANFQISIRAVYQHDSLASVEAGVPVVIMTKPAPENAAQQAAIEISGLDCVGNQYERLRIVE